jgi:hypothetical protein
MQKSHFLRVKRYAANAASCNSPGVAALIGRELGNA